MRSSFRSDHGASAVIVAISLLVLFGAGAIAIDLGSGFETKRDLITDTDSGATAAALTAASAGCGAGAQTAALDFMSRNLGQTLTAGDIEYSCDAPTDVTQPNTVRVGLTQQAQQTLSTAIGVDAIDVFASSTAAFNGFASGGLRPIAVCSAASIFGSLLPPTAIPNPNPTTIVSLGKTWTDPACGGGAGNWGYLCFDVSSGCGEPDIDDWLENGFDRDVTLGTANGDGSPHTYNSQPGGTDEDCDPDAGTGKDWCLIRSGQAVGSNAGDSAIMNGLVNQTFSIVVSDCIGRLDASGVCIAGSNAATFVHPYALAYVTLDAWCIAKNNVNNSTWSPASTGLTNAQCHDAASGNNDLVLSLTIRDIRAAGTQTDFVNPLDPAVALCGVDGDTVDHRCERIGS